MAPKSGKKEDWQDLDVGVDSRLPPAHTFLFFLNACVLAGAPIYLFSAIFDLDIEENIAVYGAVSVIVAGVLTLSCQNMSKNIRTKLTRSRGIELESTTQLKLKEIKESGDGNKANEERIKAKIKDTEKKRSEINAEALALSLATTNATFLVLVVVLAFWLMRNQTTPVNYAVSSSCTSAIVLYLSTVRGK